MAVIVILFITVMSILATLVPQGQQVAFYYHTFGATLGGLIVATGFSSFFRSALFLAPSVLFFASLAVCTIDRMVGRISRGAKLRMGPDFVHLGLLMLIVGGIITAFGRREGQVYMAVGDEVELTEQVTIALDDYQFVRYEGGRPRDWISTVHVVREGRVVVEDFAIEVNRPLRVAGLRIFQANYAEEARADMTDGQGQTYTIKSGQAFRDGENMFLFAGIDEVNLSGVFDEYNGHQKVGERRVSARQQIGSYTFANPRIVEVTGLKVVRDPGVVPVIVSLLILAAGLGLTYIQKIGDEKK
jgi:cytochrome c biogenesis protein